MKPHGASGYTSKLEQDFCNFTNWINHRAIKILPVFLIVIYITVSRPFTSISPAPIYFKKLKLWHNVEKNIPVNSCDQNDAQKCIHNILKL